MNKLTKNHRLMQGYAMKIIKKKIKKEKQLPVFLYSKWSSLTDDYKSHLIFGLPILPR